MRAVMEGDSAERLPLQRVVADAQPGDTSRHVRDGARQ